MATTIAAEVRSSNRSDHLPTVFATTMIATPHIDDVRRQVAQARSRGCCIGCVPTMGALHEGHFSLIEAARKECDFVAVTIFVNPMQFGPNEDLDRYPRTLERDLAACEQRGVDLVFHPDQQTVYPPGFCTYVEVEGLSDVLEGHFRPGHFRGVTTVVLKLFEIVRPDRAYFGQKDFQQQLIIRRMCRDLNVPVEIRVCPIVREPDGLALSSRNVYLSEDDRQKALRLSQALGMARERLTAGERDVAAVMRAMREHLEAVPGVRVDYATIADPETLEELSQPQAQMVALVAARVGETRLIDNMLIQLPVSG